MGIWKNPIDESVRNIGAKQMKRVFEMMISLAHIVVIGLGDYRLKNCVEKNIPWKKRFPVFGGWGEMQKYHNYGAFLNMGDKSPGLVGAVSIFLFIMASGVFLLTFTMKGKYILKMGLSLLLGGAFSNTYDRMYRHYVVDYLSFPKCKQIQRIVFNISDFCIMAGAMLIALSDMKEK